MPGARYNAIPREYWSALGPAFKGLSDDLAAVEAGGGGGGTPLTSGSTVVTSGPYTLDPKRAPAGTLVAIPDTQPILTHIGTRFAGVTKGVDLSMTAQPAGTIYLTKAGTGTVAYDDTGYFTRSLKLTTTATATDIVSASTGLPASVRDVKLSIMFRVSAAPTADQTILSLYRTGGSYASVLIFTGTVAGKMRLIANDPSKAGWEYTSPDVDPSGRFRIAINALSVDGASTSLLRIAFFSVAANGTETQIGTTYENTAVVTDMTGQNFTTLSVGKLAGQASFETQSLFIDSIRAAYGAGAATSGLLQPETLYPEPV